MAAMREKGRNTVRLFTCPEVKPAHNLVSVTSVCVCVCVCVCVSLHARVIRRCRTSKSEAEGSGKRKRRNKTRVTGHWALSHACVSGSGIASAGACLISFGTEVPV